MIDVFFIDLDGEQRLDDVTLPAAPRVGDEVDFGRTGRGPYFRIERVVWRLSTRHLVAYVRKVKP